MEVKEINILQNVSNACQSSAQRDSFNIFGDYVARKLRRLSNIIDDDIMETIKQVQRKIRNVKYIVQPRGSYLSSPLSQMKETILLHFLTHKAKCPTKCIDKANQVFSNLVTVFLKIDLSHD